MAQRKPSTTSASRKAAPRSAPAKRPPAKKKPGKSIVNQKQTPWGLIATVAVVVVFAAGIIVYAVVHNSSKKSCTKMIGNNSTTYLNELQCARDIQGVTFKPQADRNHVQGTVKYDSSPPVGGNHSQYWADCTGTVYANAIASENAVHSLEHGAVWITYRQGLAESEVAKLATFVEGKDRMLMSPYPNLKSPISLQSWGYQLFVNSASDSRIEKFITALRYNSKTTPELGATCSQPTFKQQPSTFGHPLWQPASGATGNTMSP
jgi:Protein of unknown function (DUF3105)